MTDKTKNILKWGALIVILILSIGWRIIENNNRKKLDDSSDKDTNPPIVEPDPNEEDEYDYQEAHDRFNTNPNTDDANNPENNLDPIWQLTNSNNKIYQIDFTITISYVGDRIHLDIALLMTDDELLEQEKYREIYINKVLEYFQQQNLDVSNYEITYSIPT